MSATPRTLTARSVLLSVLLGSDPPRLPVPLLVRTTALFGIAEGTTRTALSRMTAAGEVRAEERHGTTAYTLVAPGLLQRRRRQELSRRGTVSAWDGTWVQAVVVADGARPAPERARRRAELGAARLAERRDGVWLRPDNLGTERLADPDLEWYTVRPDDDPAALAAALWDLDAWAERARDLRRDLAPLTRRLERGDREVLADGFVLSAAVLRHFQADPLLPDDLVTRWPGADLRRDYDHFDHAYRAVLGQWFADQSVPHGSATAAG